MDGKGGLGAIGFDLIWLLNSLGSPLCGKHEQLPQDVAHGWFVGQGTQERGFVLMECGGQIRRHRVRQGRRGLAAGG